MSVSPHAPPALNAALIVAAGRGHRFGGAIPKQYRQLAGEAVLRHTLRAFLAHPRIGALRVVIHPDDGGLFAEATVGLDIAAPVAGGATRQDSVRRGLDALAPLAPATVLIHDAVRPFVAAATIDAVLDQLDRTAGAIAALPVVDTLKRGAGGLVLATVDRGDLWRAQTPQGFRFPALLAAHRAAAGLDLTDDAQLAERAGMAVALVTGSEAAFKITTEPDLERAEQMLHAIARRS